MRKIGFLFLLIIATIAFVGCVDNEGDGDGDNTPNLKKLTNCQVQYVDDVDEGLQRYIVTLKAIKKDTRATDFSKSNISLSLELITPKSESYASLATGDYEFSETEIKSNIIANTENSFLNVFTETSYGGDKALIKSGTISVSSFNGKYEIKGEITDNKGRVLNFSFYNEPDFIALTPSSTITFEEAVLTQTSGTYSNILWGKEKATDVNGAPTYNDILYTEASASFGSSYTYSAEYQFESWGGFVISSNRNLSNLGWDYANQFSVYAPTANKFAIAYYNGEWGYGYANPIIEFKAPVVLISADIANANKTYHYCIDSPTVGDGDEAEDIWVNLIATGHNGGAQTKEITIKLADNGQVIDDWTKVSLLELGVVDKVTFAIDSNSKNAQGLLVPTFVCIDNIAIK